VTLTALADIEYGNLFGAWSSGPFSQFELDIQASLSQMFYSLSLVSNGVLVGRPVFETWPRYSSLSISMDYDLVYNSRINFSAHSLGLSYRHLREWIGGASLRLGFHANWVVLGASDFIYLRLAETPSAEEERRDYDLGTGEGVKVSFELHFPSIGLLSLSYSGYGLHTIGGSVPDGGSPGYTLLGIGTLRLERPITATSSTGTMFTMYHKRGFYQDVPDIQDRVSTLSLYVRKHFS
jgi:hypothetical protein